MPHIATSHYASAAEIARRWGVHRSTVGRIMVRFGAAGLKFGLSPQSTRRYAWTDVHRIEKANGMTSSSEVSINHDDGEETPAEKDVG